MAPDEVFAVSFFEIMFITWRLAPDEASKSVAGELRALTVTDAPDDTSISALGPATDASVIDPADEASMSKAFVEELSGAVQVSDDADEASNSVIIGPVTVTETLCKFLRSLTLFFATLISNVLPSITATTSLMLAAGPEIVTCCFLSEGI